MRRSLLAAAGALALSASVALAAAYTTSPRRVAKALLGYATNEFEHITYSAHATEKPCPEPASTLALIVMGQSNAGNSVVGLPVERPNPRTAVFYGGRCYEAVGPLVGNGGINGAVWPAVAGLLAESHPDRKILIASMAVGGTSVRQWASGGELHAMWVDRLAAVRAAGYEAALIVWHQGETDHFGDPDTYTVRLTSVVRDAREAHPSWPFMVAVATYCQGKASPRIAEAQRRVAHTAAGAILGPDTDQLGALHRADGCHFNPAGAQRAASLWHDAIAAALRAN